MRPSTRSPTRRTPLRPIDLTDDASVAAVLDLAVRVGEVTLASGTGVIDTVAQVKFIAATYGLARCDVDVTYNSITISADRGPTRPPASTMRIVHYRSLDFTRLAAVDRLTRRIRLQAVPPDEAYRALIAITSAPHPYNRWVATFAWSGMAAAIGAFLGGGALVVVVSFFTTMVIDRTNRILNKFGLPFFFQNVVGGAIAAAPAITLFAFADSLGIDINPSQVIAAGIVVLLSGLSLVGSVQDAITGAPITAAARLLEVVMMTGGIIAGVAFTLRVAVIVHAKVPILNTLAPPDLTEFPTKIIAGGIATMMFALASYAERRALTAAAFGGAAGIACYLIVGAPRVRARGGVVAGRDRRRVRRRDDGAARVHAPAGRRGRRDHAAATGPGPLPRPVRDAERPTSGRDQLAARRVRGRLGARSRGHPGGMVPRVLRRPRLLRTWTATRTPRWYRPG